MTSLAINGSLLSRAAMLIILLSILCTFLPLPMAAFGSAAIPDTECSCSPNVTIFSSSPYDTVIVWATTDPAECTPMPDCDEKEGEACKAVIRGYWVAPFEPVFGIAASAPCGTTASAFATDPGGTGGLTLTVECGDCAPE